MDITIYKPKGTKEWQVKGTPPPGSDVCKLRIKATITGVIKGWFGVCEKGQ